MQPSGKLLTESIIEDASVFHLGASICVSCRWLLGNHAGCWQLATGYCLHVTRTARRNNQVTRTFGVITAVEKMIDVRWSNPLTKTGHCIFDSTQSTDVVPELGTSARFHAVSADVQATANERSTLLMWSMASSNQRTLITAVRMPIPHGTTTKTMKKNETLSCEQ